MMTSPGPGSRTREEKWPEDAFTSSSEVWHDRDSKTLRHSTGAPLKAFSLTASLPGKAAALHHCIIGCQLSSKAHTMHEKAHKVITVDCSSCCHLEDDTGA